MDEMITADTKAISVATGHDDCKVVISQFHACGYGKRTAMQGMHAIGIDESGEIRRAADAADSDHVVIWDLQLDERLLNRSEDSEVPTSRTPVGIHLSLQICHRYVPLIPLRGRHGFVSLTRIPSNQFRESPCPHTKTSCSGTESLDLPLNCSFTASTM